MWEVLLLLSFSNEFGNFKRELFPNISVSKKKKKHVLAKKFIVLFI